VRLFWSDEGWDDYLHWQENDRKTLAKINELVKDIRRNPFKGLGKPEPLKERFTGWWSRRITDEHWLVYRVIGKSNEQVVEIVQCRGHY
jgi:toxin YoeB